MAALAGDDWPSAQAVAGFQCALTIAGNYTFPIRVPPKVGKIKNHPCALAGMKGVFPVWRGSKGNSYNFNIAISTSSSRSNLRIVSMRVVISRFTRHNRIRFDNIIR